MTRRLIISGTREALSDEDRAIVTGVAMRCLERAWMVGIGDCPTGIDPYAATLAHHAGVPQVERFVARWDEFGRRAGPERNGRMVAWAAEGARGGLLLAFPGPRSRGTWDCVRKARGAGLDVVIKRVGGAR